MADPGMRVKGGVSCPGEYARRVGLGLVAAAVLVGLASPVDGQEGAGPAPGGAGRNPAQAPSGVYVNESFEIRRALRQIDDLAGAGRWEEAASQCARLIEDHPGELVREPGGTFTSVILHVQRRIAGWPEEGRAAFEGYAGPKAAAALEAATREGSPSAVRRVYEGFFATEAGLRAGLWLADRALQEGRPAEARRILLDLLEWHPQVARRPWGVWLRLAVAAKMRGDEAGRLQWEQHLREVPPEASVVWQGREQPVAQALASVAEFLALGSLAAAGVPSDPRFGAARVATVDAYTHIWTFAIPRGSGDDGRQWDEDADDEDGADVILPVADAERVCFTDGRAVYALRPDVGKALWVYAPRSVSGEAQRARDDGEHAVVHDVAVARGRVYAVLRRLRPRAYRLNMPRGEGELVCLDAQTGRLVWSVTTAAMSGQYAVACFDRAPVLWRGRAYVVTRRRRSFGFEDCYLTCLDAQRGRVLWEQHLGSGSTGNYGYRAPTVSLPCVAEGVVYACSNIGTLAAVDADSGTLIWLATYPSARPARRGGLAQAVPAWQYNPLLIWRDALVALPLDGQGVLVIDRRTGEIQQQHSRSDLDNVRMLLGVVGDRMVYVGDRVGAASLPDLEPLWRRVPADPRISGRAAMTTERIYLPTRARLDVMTVEGAPVAQPEWEQGVTPGSVVVTPAGLFVTTEQAVHALASREVALAGLKRRAMESPLDPGRWLDLADVALRTGEIDIGWEAIHRCDELWSTYGPPADVSVWRRAFRVVVEAADRLAGRGPGGDDQAERLYAQAERYAREPGDRVELCFKWARLLERRGRIAEAIARYQQVLADRSLREWEFSSGGAGRDRVAGRGARVGSADWPPGTGAAGTLAEERITMLLREHGFGPYERFDLQATQIFRAALERQDAEQLQELLLRYPHARVAPEALLEAGRLLRQQGRAREAARLLQRFQGRFAQRCDPAQLMYEIAVSFREAGQPEVAAAWLVRAAQEYPRAQVRVGGEDRPLSALLEEFGTAGVLERSLPRLRLPLRPGASRDASEVYLLEPRQRSAIAHDWLLTYSRQRLQAYDPQDLTPRWAAPPACRMEPILIGFVETDGSPMALLRTRYQVFAVDLERGAVAWRFGEYPIDLDDALADPEQFTSFYGEAFGGGRLVAFMDDGQGVGLDPRTGRVLWRRELPARPEEVATVNEEYLAFASRASGRSRVYVLRSADGSVLHEMPVEGGGQVKWMALTPAATLAIATLTDLAAFDVQSGRRLWRQRLDGRIYPATIHVALDGIILWAEGLGLIKHALHEGRILWTSPEEEYGPHTREAYVHVDPTEVLVCRGGGLRALDPVRPWVLWEGVCPPEGEFVQFLMSGEYCVAIHRSVPADAGEEAEPVYRAYFYDRRGHSGRIPREGGVLRLPVATDAPLITLRNDALIAWDGGTLRTFVSADATSPAR